MAATATERLKQATQVLRSRLADERGYYMRQKKRFEVYYPNEWKILSGGIIAIANYYHGEIVRAKHDLADWMNGHEVHGTYGDLGSVDDFHSTIDDVLEVLEKTGKAKARYDSAKTPEEASDRRYEYDEAISERDSAIEFMQSLIKDIEENSYAER